MLKYHCPVSGAQVQAGPPKVAVMSLGGVSGVPSRQM